MVVAERMGMSQGTISHWLSGRRHPGLDDFKNLAASLYAPGLPDITEAELVYGVPDQPEGLAVITDLVHKIIDAKLDSRPWPDRRTQDLPYVGPDRRAGKH